MIVIDSLRAISLYPINPATAELIATECGLDVTEEVNATTMTTKEYLKAKAKVYQYLAEAPTVTEAGATYSFSDEERKAFRDKADAILASIGEDEASGIECGWIGEEL